MCSAYRLWLFYPVGIYLLRVNRTTRARNFEHVNAGWVLAVEWIMRKIGYFQRKLHKFNESVWGKFQIITFFSFLFVIWLTHGRLWTIIEGQLHSPDVNQCVIHFWPKSHRESRNELNHPSSSPMYLVKVYGSGKQTYSASIPSLQLHI